MTSRTLYSCTMSLDGFMAGPGGDMQWLHQAPRAEPGRRRHRVAGRLAAGGASYVRRRRPQPRHGPGGRVRRAVARPVVRAHPLPRPYDPVPDTTFVTDLETGVAAAREAAGGRYVNVLGAESPGSASPPGCSTRSWSWSCPSSSATAPASSTGPAATASTSGCASSPTRPRHRQPLVRRRPARTPSRRKEATVIAPSRRKVTRIAPSRHVPTRRSPSEACRVDGDRLRGCCRGSRRCGWWSSASSRSSSARGSRRTSSTTRTPTTLVWLRLATSAVVLAASRARPCAVVRRTTGGWRSRSGSPSAR